MAGLLGSRRQMKLDGSKRMPIGLSAILLCLTFATRLHAGPDDELASCAAIDDPSARLTCYDRLAGRRLPEGTGKWVLSQRRSAESGDQALYLTLNAEATVPDAMAPWQFGQLILRCDSGNTDAMVAPRQRMGTSTLGVDVLLRVDGGSQTREIWSISDDAMFALEPQAVDWIRSLYGASRLDLVIKRDQDPPIDFTFNLEGLQTASAPLAAACHW